MKRESGRRFSLSPFRADLPCFPVGFFAQLLAVGYTFLVVTGTQPVFTVLHAESLLGPSPLLSSGHPHLSSDFLAEWLGSHSVSLFNYGYYYYTGVRGPQILGVLRLFPWPGDHALPVLAIGPHTDQPHA